MNDLKLSINGLYLFDKEKIYFVNESKSYDIDDISFNQWVDIFKENTLFSLKNNILEIKELYSFNRKMVYGLSEYFSHDEKSKTLFEYEIKFGNNLLVENAILLENIFTDSWEWIKGKFSNMGSWAVQLGKNLATCTSGGGCSPFFEQFRELLFNPVSIGLQVFLTVAFPGVGNLGMGFVWGIMTMYDGYLLATGDPKFSWLNLIFDILGVVFSGVGLAAAARTAVGGSKGAAAMAGKSLDTVMSSLSKNPKISNILQSLGKVFSSILSKLKPIGDFMLNKMGFKWIGKAFKAIENAVTKLITKISPNANPKYAIATGKGTRSTSEFLAFDAAIHGGGALANKLSGSGNLDKAIIDANKKIKADYSKIEF